MQLDNSFVVPVPKAEAWPLLLDIERIAPCMPGATLDSVDVDSFHGRVKVKLGAVQVAYQGEGTFVERDEPSGTVRLAVKGTEVRGSGTASATVTATLSDEGDATKVLVSADLLIGGKAAQFGRGIMAEVAGRIIGQFAERLSELIENNAAAQPRAEPFSTPVPPAPQEAVDLGAIALPAVVKRAALPVASAVLVVVALFWCARRHYRSASGR